MGTTVREILEEHAGGMRDGLHASAACCRAAPPPTSSPTEHLDVPMDFDSRAEGRQPAGHRHDDRPRRPDLPGGHGAQPGALLRPGILRLVHALPRGAALGRRRCSRRSKTGEGEPSDLDMLRAARAGCSAPGHTFCALAPGAVEPLQSALKYFRDDFERHITREALPVEITHGDDLHRRQAVRGRGRAEPARRPACRWASTCPTSAGTRRWARWAPAGSARSSSSRTRTTRAGRIVMACMTPAADGTRISIDDPEAAAFRARRHRVADGQSPARLPGLRRGRRVPSAGHDRDDRARLPALPLPEAHLPQPGPGAVRQPRDEPLHPVLPLRALLPRLRRRARLRRLRLRTTTSTSAAHEDGALESEFSGNLVEVCPTGVFTDKTLQQHYTRKWDLQTAPSVCVHCGLGCNTIPGERYGTLRRIRNRYNGEVNGYFLCDRGRYGYEFVNSAGRASASRAGAARQPHDAPRQAVEPLRRTARRRRAASSASARRAPRWRSNFALRTLVGPERFYAGHRRTRVRGWSR